MTHDTELLARYAARRDESAFADLVRRHLDHVYATALRLVGGDAHLAEDVAQAVFTDLARKAGSLRDCPALSGWLHTSARFAAAKLVRTEQRRRQREQTALTMPATSPEPDPGWEELRPVLDDAIGELDPADRDALLLRYFEKKLYAEVGTALGVSENAARMRVDRALDKLRTRLASRGITSTATAIGTALAGHVVGTAPVALVAQITRQALAAAGGVSTGAGSWVGSLTPTAKLVLGMLAVTIASLLFRVGLNHSRQESNPAAITTNADVAALTANRVHPSLRGGESGAAVANEATGSRGLELFFVDAETGLPVANQEIGLRGWVRGQNTLKEKLVQLDETGRCIAPFERLSESHIYWILTRVEGYADTRLRWNPQRGEVIPDTYTVRLMRPVALHGRVVDPAGKPVEEASVGFGTGSLPVDEAKPEDHGLDAIRVVSDAEGRWQIARVAPDVIRYLGARASHPRYSESQTLDLSKHPEAAQQLLDGTYVFRLGEAGVVHGTVVDSAGQPVAGALVRVGGLDTVGTRETHSEGDGRFTVEGCRLGQEIVTADLEGYAPTAGLAVIGSNSAPMNLILGTGKTLRVRVVDPSGQPLAGATAFFNPFSGRRNDVLPQVTFQERSDAEGRIVWEHAPDQDLEFSFHATGFFERRGVELRTRDQEYVVTLSPVLTITGTVRDADTGRALPRFRMGIGWPEAALDGSIQPWWNNIGRFWPYFRGGGFRHVLTEAVIGGTSNRGYIFRFDAEGYSPQVTRVYRPDEGEVTMDIRLHRAEGTWITIYDHAGLPAAASEIGLLAPGSGLRLGLRGLTCRGDAGSIWILRADERGRVLLPADDSVRRVAVVHAEGYAESDAEELRRGRAIRLQPWGRVEGVWLEKGAPKSNGQVSLEPSSKAPDALPLDFGDYRAQSDSVGRFVFPRVPPGSLQLVEWRAEPPPNTARTAYPAATIQVRPGGTNHVQMGDGAATTGR